jgi:type I restriction enzyme, S subunit
MIKENKSIPSEWKYVTLSDAVDKGSSNISLNKVKEDNGGYPLFSAKGLFKHISFYHQEKKYLAIIKDGAGIGRVTEHPAKSSIVGTMQYLIPKEGFDIGFIRYFLNGIDFESHRQGSTIPHIYFKDYKSEPFPLLALSQQKQIVATLDKAFAAIDTAKANAEQNLNNAKELFENTLQILFDNKDWENKRLGEVASFKNGMNFTKSSLGQSIEIVGVKNFKNRFWVPFKELEKVTLDGEMSEEYQLKRGDIIIVRSNGNPKLIGRTLLADEVYRNVSHSGFTIRIRLNPNTLLPVFLCHYLKTSRTRKELVDSGNGVGIKSLNQGSLSSLMIPCPKSEEEQKLIVNKIEGFSKQTKKLEAIYTQKIADLEEMKKSLLQKAFSGQLNLTS